MATMKAVVKTKPELGAELLDKPVPKPQSDWVVVKVRATSICGTDVHIYKWDPWSAERIGAKALPQILGHEVAGEVVEVGGHCKRIKVGDYISAETHIYDPGDLTSMLGSFHVGMNMKILGVDFDGCFAEYFALPESICWPNDPSIPPEVAAIQEPLGNATYAVLGEDADVAGKTMVITGDGPISLFASGVARACGAARIRARPHRWQRRGHRPGDGGLAELGGRLFRHGSQGRPDNCVRHRGEVAAAGGL